MYFYKNLHKFKRMYLKNLQSLVDGGLLVLLILLVGTRALPQQSIDPIKPQNEQQQPQHQVVGPTQSQQSQAAQASQPQKDATPILMDVPHLQATPQHQDQPPITGSSGLPSNKDQPSSSSGQVPLATNEPRTTTVSPYKLSTVIPDKDFNKDILDYGDTYLADLQFSLPKAPANQQPGSPVINQIEYTKSLVNRYHNYDQLYAYLLELAQSYPKITRLYDIGTSVEGRKLWVFEISETPGKHEPLKPEVRYIANMHGNEPVGRELLLHLARLILENYYATEDPAQDAEKPAGYKFIRKLVRATRIHLMPSMNPDGFERSDVGCMFQSPSRKGRVNANNVDLNRNFPDKQLGTQVDAGTQPETRAVIDWSKKVPFVLSANMHGGAVVAVIPYDSSANVSTLNQADERKCPDHETFFDLTRAYTTSHWTMSKGDICYDKCTNYHSEVFPNDGITTGSGWYQFYGSMQDWMYDNTNDFHITLELGCNQYPPAESLIQYWDMNKAAMLNFMRQVHRGIKGMVVDATTDLPMANVNVHVRTIDHNVTSTHAGDYFRLLAPGIYQVLFEHSGYHTEEIHVTLGNTMAQIHNIRMRPNGQPMGQPQGPGAPSGSEQPIVVDDERTIEAGAHPVAVATLVMSVITVALLIFLAGAYVIQKRRFKRSQSVSVELQPTGRQASGTGVNLPPFKSTSTGGSGSTLSAHMQA